MRWIVFGLLFISLILNAQTDYKPGYVISLNGDTLLGDIDYRGDLSMSKLCKFKHADNTVTEYSPSDIEAFRFTDSKYYVSREINSEAVFLEYLIKGKVSIYYMRDAKGNHYYIDKEDIGLTEIPYEEGIKDIDGKKMFYESTRHIGFISVFMQDAPELRSQIYMIKEPKHDNLIKLAEDYHNAVCDGEKCIIYEKKQPLVKLSITPYAGLTKYMGFGQILKDVGADLSFCFPWASEKFYIKTGLAYSHFVEDGETIGVRRIPLQFQYIYKAHILQPNISAGINLLTTGHSDYKALTHTFNLNVGLDYRITDNMCITTAFKSDSSPLVAVSVLHGFSEFERVSHSVTLGLRFDL